MSKFHHTNWIMGKMRWTQQYHELCRCKIAIRKRERLTKYLTFGKSIKKYCLTREVFQG